MDKKMTYIDALNTAINHLTDTMEINGEPHEDNAVLTETVAKLTALKEQLVKRNASKSDKPTKTQKENAEIKARIHEFLTHTLQGVRCGDVASELGISGQKASALLSQMVKTGEVVKREGEKRVTLFLLPENDMSREDVE